MSNIKYKIETLEKLKKKKVKEWLYLYYVISNTTSIDEYYDLCDKELILIEEINAIIIEIKVLKGSCYEK